MENNRQDAIKVLKAIVAQDYPTLWEYLDGTKYGLTPITNHADLIYYAATLASEEVFEPDDIAMFTLRNIANMEGGVRVEFASALAEVGLNAIMARVYDPPLDDPSRYLRPNFGRSACANTLFYEERK